MRKPFIVRPTGLKGNEKLDRMRELMGATPLNEDVKNSVVELTKIGPDGKVYGIVREGHNYFIKVTDKKTNLVTEDFNYIGGLANKTSEAYPTYAKAIKQLNLKFMSLNEAYGKQGNFNIFEDDNLLTEHHPYKADQALSATKGMGDGAEYIVDKAGTKLSYDSKEGKDDSQFGDNIADKNVDDEFEKVKLSENEMAIEEMLGGGEEMSEGPESPYGDQVTEAEGAAQAADKVADKIEDILSPEEVEFLKNAYVSGGKEMVSKAIDAELNEGIYEGAPEPPAQGEFGMSQNEIKLRQIIDKFIKRGGLASLAGIIPAAMAGAPVLAIGLGVAALASSALKDAAWWAKKGHHYSAQNKYELKEADDSLYEAEDVARVVDKVEDKIEDILSPEEIQFLKSQNPETIANVIDDKIDEADDNTGRLKNIIDKIVKNTTIASLIGAPVAMVTQATVKAATGIPGAHGVMSGGQNIISPEVIIGLAITGVAGLAIINSDWWVKRFGKNDTNQKLKESRKGFSIQTALEKMDSIIEEVTTDKVTEILNSLTESEKEALLSTLKKKV